MSAPSGATGQGDDRRPLVVHVVYRLDTGGLENGLVNLINHLPPQAFRHAVVSLTEVTEFARRIWRDEVLCIALHKSPGHAIGLYPRMYRLFRELKPAIVHTRNLAALECVVPAWAAGVPVRIHGEHGRDAVDIDGTNWRLQLVRRIYRPFVTRYVALSRELQGYLEARIGVPPRLVERICNGVDADKFAPGPKPAIAGYPFDPATHWVIGTVGRMHPIKGHRLLVQAFIQAVRLRPDLADRLRLVVIGDGPQRQVCLDALAQASLAGAAWLPGERGDVDQILRALDCFALPSLSEGISNSILEAMATGLPVLATRVGGNTDLVREQETGVLIDSGDAESMARQLVAWADDPQTAREVGRRGRRSVEESFGLGAMMSAYHALYEGELARVAGRPLWATQARH